MDSLPWFAWIAIAGIASWTLVTMTGGFTGTRKADRDALTEALRANTDAQTETAARLDTIEERLGTIEKTLNDIP